MLIKDQQIKRINYIDILKGLGILFMITGHIGFGDKYLHYIAAFNMPIFFFISGYLFKYEKYRQAKTFIKSKIKSLLIPYISFALINYFIWTILFGIRNHFNLFKPLYSIFAGDIKNIPIAGALWFLTCIFIVEVVFYTLIGICKNKQKLLFIIIAVIVLVGNMYPKFIDYRLPFAADCSMVAIGVFYLGYIAKMYYVKFKVIDKILSLPIISICILFIANLVLIFMNGYAEIYQLNYSNVLLFWMNIVIAIIIYWNISKRIDIFNKSKFISKIKSELIFIGKNSIIYLCLNQFFIIVFTMIFQFIFGHQTIVQIFFIKISTVIATLICLYMATIIINGCKLKVLIGKFDSVIFKDKYTLNAK